MTDSALRQRFYSSIRRGTGEAWLIRKVYPELRLTELVIDACLKIEADDPQSEGSRADYLMNFIREDQAPLAIRNAVLKALSEAKDHSWHTYQQAELAVCFWEEGDDKSHDIVCDFFRRSPTDDTGKDVDGFLIHMDEFDGLVEVARKYGRASRIDHIELHRSRLVLFMEEHPEQDAENRLRAMAEADEDIAAFLHASREQQARKAGRKSAREDDVPSAFENVQQSIESKRWSGILSILAKRLSGSELLTLAEELLVETDSMRLGKYLRVFRRVSFPLPFSRLFEIYDRFASDDEFVIPTLSAVLGQIDAAEIRTLADARLRKSSHPEYLIDLLLRNYRPGDEALFLDLLHRSDDYEYIHRSAATVIKIYEAFPSPLCEEPLILIYQKMNCGIHRATVVEILHSQGLLSEKIRRELPYDSESRIADFLKTMGNANVDE